MFMRVSNVLFPRIKVDNMARKFFNRLLNMYCRARLHDKLPNVPVELKQYPKSLETTGTQPISLWLAVKAVLKNKPQFILECGTSSSTIVLLLAAQKIQDQQPDYQYKIVSMESVKEWFDTALKAVPAHEPSEHRQAILGRLSNDQKTLDKSFLLYRLQLLHC
jgi:hypothetical protein